MLKLLGIQPGRWDPIIKLTFVILFCIGLYYQIAYKQDWELLFDEFITRLKAGQVVLILVVLALMPVNWLIEAVKWRTLMQKVLHLNIWKALRAVCTGLSFSLLTPNRIGEYFGRIAHVESRQNWNAALSTLAGSISQNLINVIFGFLALLFVLRGNFEESSVLYTGAVVAMLLFSGTAIALYFRIDLLARLVQFVRIPFIKDRWVEKFNFFLTLDNSQLRSALLLSLMRYIIFCTQYVFMLIYFGAGLPPTELYAGVAVIYLIHTSIPLPPFVDQIVRAQMALFLWNSAMQNELSLLAAGFFIWIINVVLPAFVGILAVGNVRLLKSYGYETHLTHHDTSVAGRHLDEFTEN